MELKMHLLDI